MSLEKKEIAVELRTVIDDQGEKELSIIKQTGKYMKNDEIEVITFSDNVKDFGEVGNLITIHSDRVNIKRSGSITMNQQFIKGKKTECLYRHPYGSFVIVIHTKSITHQKLQQNQDGKVIIEYEAQLSEQQKRHHLLTLIYTEEKKL
ncbi:MAG TPA: DUF1934 domain-containing protein [Pseudogracilibacillus sp.]|nr:DUF1934 domain-containing protein [Pseudogracilibacillus sp.]